MEINFQKTETKQGSKKSWVLVFTKINPCQNFPSKPLGGSTTTPVTELNYLSIAQQMMLISIIS